MYGCAFGALGFNQCGDRSEKIRPLIRRWRAKWETIRSTADKALSRVLAYAVDPLSKIGGNPLLSIKQLYTADRSEVIWAVIGVLLSAPELHLMKSQPL
jgi:hypothetical protein